MKPKISKEELLECIDRSYKAWDIIKKYSLCKNTLRAYLVKYNIPTPKGFYSIEGKKSGRPKGIKCSEQQKKLMSDKFKGENNPFFGKKHDEETRKRMSENHADFTGDNNPFRRAAQQNPQLIYDLSDRMVNYWDKIPSNQRNLHLRKYIYEDITSYHWSSIKSNAKSRNIPFEITPEIAWEVFIKQDKKCALSGIKLNLNKDCEITASLDRIDSNGPYSKDNIQWIHKKINIMKMDLDQDYFIDICTSIASHKNGTRTSNGQ